MKSRILTTIALGLALTLTAHAQYYVSFQTNTIRFGFSTNWPGDYVIGSNTYADALIVSGLSTLTDTNGILGYVAGSSNNVAIIDGNLAVWYNTANLYVGYSGSDNSVIITNSGIVTNAYGFIGTNPGANRNAVTVTGANSEWQSSASVFVGYYGSSNTLAIANDGFVTDPIGQIGYESGANYNTVTITSAGSGASPGNGFGWYNSGTLNVGASGSGDTLTISGGGAVFDANGNIGLNSNGGSNNVVHVTGTGSVWSNSTDLTIGSAGSGNQLIIASAGVVDSGTGFLGYDTGANGNGVTITGVGSVWNNSGDIYVGYSGSGNDVTIAPGSSFLQGVNAVNGWIGYNTGADGNTISVSGTGSVWNSSGDIYVGNYGSSNELVIGDGGVVDDVNGWIGYNTGANGNNVSVTSGSVWNNSGNLNVGSAGSGNKLVVGSGGVVADTYGGIGVGFSSNNTLIVTDAGSAWSNSVDLGAGYIGSGNALIVSNGGAVFSAEGGSIGGPFSDSVNNAATVTGAGSVWKNNGPVYLSPGGSGNALTVANGGSFFVSSGSLIVSYNGGTASLVINGGSVTVNTLVATNGLNSVVTLHAGLLASGGTSVANNQLFVIGDGTDAATFQLNGGLHSFANNVEIRNNATLTGCGTIEGNVTIDPGGTMQTLCDPIIVEGIVTNNGTIIAANGDSINFDGPVVNSGQINAITGRVEFLGGLSGTGVVFTATNTQISGITQSGNNISIQIPSVPDASVLYQLQVTPSLTPAAWTNLSASQSGTGGVLTFTDFGAATNGPSRFYRIYVTAPEE